MENALFDSADANEVANRESISRPTRAVVDLSAISHNILGIKRRIGNKRELMAVVKADGYGHGAVEVSQSALDSGATFLGVALPEEGVQLRDSGIRAPILNLGLIQPEEAYKIIDAKMEQTICGVDVARALDRKARNAGVIVEVHIKIDTGMGRIGVEPQRVMELVRKIDGFRNIRLKGVYSHFSCADESNKDFSKKQKYLFEEVVRDIEMAGFHIPLKHFANSAAVLDLPEVFYDMVRPGIMIYGLYPSEEVSRSICLRPAMTFKTKVSYVKTVPAETPISYGRTFYTGRPSRLATIPVGYGDGYSRLLSNQGYVRIDRHKAPILGRVCMDMCIIDVTEKAETLPGDEVVLFGEDPSADDIALMMGTINYEVVCLVGKRVPRIYLRG